MAHFWTTHVSDGNLHKLNLVDSVYASYRGIQSSEGNINRDSIGSHRYHILDDAENYIKVYFEQENPTKPEYSSILREGRYNRIMPLTRTVYDIRRHDLKNQISDARLDWLELWYPYNRLLSARAVDQRMITDEEMDSAKQRWNNAGSYREELISNLDQMQSDYAALGICPELGNYNGPMHFTVYRYRRGTIGEFTDAIEATEFMQEEKKRIEQEDGPGNWYPCFAVIVRIGDENGIVYDRINKGEAWDRFLERL